MTRVISFFWIIYFIATQIICFNFAESKFSSTYSNKTHHGRTKRALFDEMPSQLKMTVRYTTGEEVDLIYKKIPHYLANKHLPVVDSQEFPNGSIMDEIGEFVLYHDLSKCSAIVFFEKFNSLNGIVGMNHYLQHLPYDFDEDGIYRSGVVGVPYLKPITRSSPHIHPNVVYPPPSDSDSWFDFLRPSNNLNQNRKRPSDSDASPSNKRQRTEGNSDADENGVRTQLESTQNLAAQHFYLETVVFVAHDIVDIFKNVYGEGQYIGMIVRYFIIYLNAVDMMFQKIEVPDRKVHINIAKIMIESGSYKLNDMNGRQLPFMGIVRSLRGYLRFHAHHYMPDSFDHVFVYTSQQIYDGTVPVNGMTKYGADLYEAKRNNEFYDGVPISLVKVEPNYADIVVAVHEIGRVFHMNVDARENGLQPFGQCYGIMQREGPKCENCLKWSDESQNRLGVFLRENRNRCFLLNEPRSLRPHGTSTFLRAATQCECFGYHSHIKYPSGLVMNLIGSNRCNRPLQCQKGYGAGSSHVSTVVPFDGTPCAKNKVCWDRRCRITKTKRWPTLHHTCRVIHS